MPLNSETEINRMGSLYFTSLPQTQWKQISERQQKGGWWWVGLDQPSLWIQINPAGAEDPASQHHSMWESQWQVSTLRGTPKVQLLFDPKCSAHTCSTLLGWCCMHCKTIHPVTKTVKTIMLPLDGIIPVYCWQSFFSSLLCFSDTFHHALFPNISLVWQHDVLVCQLLGVKVYWHFGKQATPDKHDFPAEITALHPVPFMAVIWLWEQTLQQTLEIKSFHSLALELLSHLSISFLAQNYYSLLLKTAAEKLSNVCNPLSIKKR